MCSWRMSQNITKLAPLPRPPAQRQGEALPPHRKRDPPHHKVGLVQVIAYLSLRQLLPLNQMGQWEHVPKVLLARPSYKGSFSRFEHRRRIPGGCKPNRLRIGFFLTNNKIEFLKTNMVYLINGLVLGMPP